MADDVLNALRLLEHDYYDGVGFDRLEEHVLAISQAIERLDKGDPIRSACETFAPTLWGATSGSEIDVRAIAAAFDGINASQHMQAWANFARVAETYRVAA